MKKTAFLIAAASFGLAGSAFALDVKKTVEAPASPDAVWTIIGDFCGIATWHPAIGKCEISKKDGATLRTLSLKGRAIAYKQRDRTRTLFSKQQVSFFWRGSVYRDEY